MPTAAASGAAPAGNKACDCARLGIPPHLPFAPGHSHIVSSCLNSPSGTLWPFGSGSSIPPEAPLGEGQDGGGWWLRQGFAWKAASHGGGQDTLCQAAPSSPAPTRRRGGATAGAAAARGTGFAKADAAGLTDGHPPISTGSQLDYQGECCRGVCVLQTLCPLSLSTHWARLSLPLLRRCLSLAATLLQHRRRLNRRLLRQVQVGLCWTLMQLGL